MERTKQLTLLLSVILLAFAGAASANMLVNGDLEDWDAEDEYPTGWSPNSAGATTFDRISGTDSYVIDGITARMRRVDGTPGMAQTVAFTTGEEYTLTFDWRRAASSGTGTCMVLQIRDDVAGEYVKSITYSADNTDVHSETVTFTAPRDSLIVRFKSSYTAGAVDNIVLTPEPATLAVLGVGSIGMLWRRRRR